MHLRGGRRNDYHRALVIDVFRQREIQCSSWFSVVTPMEFLPPWFIAVIVVNDGLNSLASAV